MATFHFYTNEKKTIWKRYDISIEAETYEEALALIEKYKDWGARSMECNEKSVRVTDEELDLETLDEMSLEENDGYSTIDFYDDETHAVVSSNGKC